MDVTIPTSSSTSASQAIHAWPYFLIPSIVIFFSGIFIIVVCRLIRSFLKRTGHFCRSDKDRTKINETGRRKRSLSTVTHEAFLEGLFSPNNEDDLDIDGNSITKRKTFMTRLMVTCEELLSAQTLAGVLLAILSCIFAVISLIIYFIDASQFKILEFERTSETPCDFVDLVCNVFFLVHFIFRFVASNDKLRCWIQLNSFVDIFTIVPIFVGVYMKRRWLGIRFICAFRLLNFPDVLQFLRVLKNATHIRLLELTSLFFCVWLTSSGFVHLVENSGDFFDDYRITHNMTYGECLYFIIITMSTVGYGDYACITVTGKAFSVLFIFGAVALFASYVPEIIDIVNSSRQNYLSEYKKEIGFRHIIVGGHISLKTVKNFVRDFTHDDRTKNNLKGIFLSSIEPTLEIETVFKQLYTRLVFVKGSMMNATDLKRVRLSDAEAVLILSDHMTPTPDSDDTDNIMRAIAVKNSRPSVRVILQLIKVENKIICSNLPFWTDNDNIICFNEVKMGYMAAGCLAPGFSTFLTNLLFMLSHDDSSDLLPWQEDYMKGAEMEAYTEKFSTFFYGRSLSEVVEFCYIRLRLLLVAVSGASDKNNNVQSSVILNPGPEYHVCSHTIGFFICPSEDDCQCVRHYCLKCHCNVPAESIKPCTCESVHMYKSLLSAEMGGFGENRGRLMRSGIFSSEEEILEDYDQEENERVPFFGQYPQEDNDFERFDITGYFHWCPHKTFEESLLDESATLSNHIILCFSDSSQGSLRSFILPLRASCFSYSRLRTIVIVAEDEAKLRSEWPSVAYFPKVFVKVGSPMNRGFLRSIHVEACHMCVILSSNYSLQNTDSTAPLSNDSRALLVTLNINNMVSPAANHGLNSEVLKVLYSQSYQRQCSAISVVTHSGSNSTIPLLTELTKDENVHLLSENVSDAYVPFHLNQPFACGKTFAPRVIDALTPTIFFSPATYKLIRMFVNWTDSEEYEQLIAEGILDGECHMSPEKLERIRSRCIIDLLPLSRGVLEPYTDNTFEHLLVNVLQKHRILCLGVYRFMSIYDKQKTSDDRFVITNPPADFKLDKTDLVYCLYPPDKL